MSRPRVYADAADLGVLIAAFNTTPGDAVWNAAADINGDGSVDALDLSALINAFNTRLNPDWNPAADLNCDNSVDALDLALLIHNFNQQGEP